jgi:rare lipoprotein A
LRPRFPLRRTRSVHVIIAMTMLAVPASALAFSGVTTETAPSAQNPVPTPLKLHISPRRITFGATVAFAGTAPATDAGRRVVLQTAASSGAPWRSLATAKVSRSGRFRARVRPRRSGLVRAVEQPPATAVATATSAPAATPGAQPSVAVGARFTPARHASAVVSTHPVHIGGKLLPAVAGRRVRLERHTARGWRRLGSARTGARGGYRMSFSPAGADGQSLRVVFGGDRRNARAVRSAGTVHVLHPALASWYQDAGNTACGFHAGLGVANRSLPCGTKVTFQYGGRSVTAVVDDRGPYAGGREWDLNQTTAAALGFAGVGTVWSSR